MNNNIAEYLEKHKDFSNKRFVRGKIVTKLDQLFSNFPKYRMGQLLSYWVLQKTKNGKTRKKDIWSMTDEELFTDFEAFYKQLCKEEEEEQSDFYDTY